MRRAIAVLMILGGLVLIVISFFLSAPWGTEAVRNSNPRVQFAPAFFVLGVMAVFLAAVVYELLPDRRHK